MKTFVTAICLVICLYSSVCAGQYIQIDPDKLTPEQVQQLYILKQAQEGTSKALKGITVNDVEKYASIGQGVARALGAACRELGVEVNEFAKTPVGKLTTVLIVYKIIGVRPVVATIAWLVVMIMSIWIFKKFLGSERIETDGKVMYISKYPWDSHEAKTVATIFNVAIPAAMTLLWVLIV
jgi:hypothetical protein